VSVEYALFEKLPKDLRVTISVDSGWEDAGTWQLFYDAMIEKGETDVVEGPMVTEFLDSKKNLVLSTNKKKLISIIGLKNIAVIDTKDALLVCDLDETQKVKKLYNKLVESKNEYTE
jgi:mannose-1-phosphate guanylyltransferase